jgi:hypothetical protein
MTDEPEKKVRKPRPKNGQRSKAKGREYEHELANYFNDKLYMDTSRALLSGSWSGGDGADLQGTPHIHVEAKRTEAINIKAHLRQAKGAVDKRGSKSIPVVITRQNRMATGDSIVALRLQDFVKLYGSYLVLQYDAEEIGNVDEDKLVKLLKKH